MRLSVLTTKKVLKTEFTNVIVAELNLAEVRTIHCLQLPTKLVEQLGIVEESVLMLEVTS